MVGREVPCGEQIVTAGNRCLGRFGLPGFSPYYSGLGGDGYGIGVHFAKNLFRSAYKERRLYRL